MIRLSDSNFLGKGRKRIVYIHPDNSDKCIKISKRKRNNKNIRRELSCFANLKKDNISWNMMIKYYEKVQTNKGVGYVFDLVKDFDGNISETLDSYFNDYNKFILIPDIIKKITNLKKYVFNNKIIFDDPNLKNILYKKISEDDGVFIIVDGVENTEFIPISTYINYFRKKKIIRCLNKFDQKLLSYPVYKDLIKKNLD